MRLGFWLAMACLLSVGACAARRYPAPSRMEQVRVADDGGFELFPSRRPFVPWGFNYDHDEKGRLLEDYWDREWSKVEEDFNEMRQLGANVIRIHLQMPRFMPTPDRVEPIQLERLRRLARLCERLGLYLDVTGLGCYRKQDVPGWYDACDEAQRWQAQARFWEAVSATLIDCPAVFCYDLMNEPVVPAGKREPGDWLGPPFGEYCYVQFISLDQAGRPRAEIAKQWIRCLRTAIRKHDTQHLVTVGLVPWSLDRPGLTSGFVPTEIAPELDFLAVHLYPEEGRLNQAVEILRGFAIGKPLIIEETFPLACSMETFDVFLSQSARFAAGWIGFYWGKTASECELSEQIADRLMHSWLTRFRVGPPRQWQLLNNSG